MAMEKQYCKVGAIHPMADSLQGLQILENHYHHFIRKAEEATTGNGNLREFFEGKARKFQQLIQELV